MIGRRFGEWIVLSKAERTDKKYHDFWWCQCTCGQICVIRGDNLRRGTTHKCMSCATWDRFHGIKTGDDE